MLNVILKENEISAKPTVNISSNFEILERELKVNTKMSVTASEDQFLLKLAFASGDQSEELSEFSQVWKAIPFWKVADPSFDSLFPVEDESSRAAVLQLLLLFCHWGWRRQLRWTHSALLEWSREAPRFGPSNT